MMNCSPLRKTLESLRSLRTERYLAATAVASALARTLGDIPPLPWEQDAECHVGGDAGSVFVVDRTDVAGPTEVHLWTFAPGDLRWALNHAATILSDPYVMSLASGGSMYPRGAEHRPCLDELVLHRAPGTGGNDALVMLSRDGPDALARTGAYARELAGVMHDSELDAAVMVDTRGRWRSRCHLERLDRDVVEVAGFLTHPGCRRRGWGSRLLRAINPPAKHLVYLSPTGNSASIGAARSAGFCPLTVYRKYLVQ